MNIPFTCVAFAFLLNYISKIPVAIAMHQQGGMDNQHPREQQARLTGWGKRALGAHLNGFEIFPAFAAAVIVAHLAHVDAKVSAILSITFVISRVVYLALYLANWSTTRSLVWGVGMLSTATLFVLAIFIGVF